MTIVSQKSWTGHTLGRDNDSAQSRKLVPFYSGSESSSRARPFVAEPNATHVLENPGSVNIPGLAHRDYIGWFATLPDTCKQSVSNSVLYIARAYIEHLTTRGSTHDTFLDSCAPTGVDR
jgi:hypothetical protein